MAMKEVYLLAVKSSQTRTGLIADIMEVTAPFKVKILDVAQVIPPGGLSTACPVGCGRGRGRGALCLPLPPSASLPSFSPSPSLVLLHSGSLALALALSFLLSRSLFRAFSLFLSVCRFRSRSRSRSPLYPPRLSHALALARSRTGREGAREEKNGRMTGESRGEGYSRRYTTCCRWEC